MLGRRSTSEFRDGRALALIFVRLLREGLITGSVALSLINNGTIVTHQVDPPDRVDQSNVQNWSRSITLASRRPDTGVIGCG